ncbi:MAG TPA: SufS family cysteine desulfurase, partial [Tepidisphaeraceae bacterium]|nr:SufS family cysteine desulfurase [Tepidisphaeraceae bacterium]
ASARLDVERVRADFPILRTLANGRPLVYLDNAATTQKPRAVIDALTTYYESQNANIHRGVYHLSMLATDLYDASRRKVQKFLGAAEAAEIIFTRGTTEAINLVAAGASRKWLKPGDEVLVSAMEHHSNIVPWQLACEHSGASLRVIPMNDDGELLLDELESMLSERAKIVAVNHVSNALGTVNDVKRIVRMAHAVGAKVLVDGAQATAHTRVDVRDIDCDFYALSGHKLFGPTGIGALYGKRAALEALPPYQGGGDMIESVTFEKSTYAQLPSRLEAGTPDIAGAIGLGAAVDYVQSVGLEKIEAHEHELLDHLVAQLRQVPGVRLIGNARNRAGAVSFVLENPVVSAHDLGVALDLHGVAVRTGHHCCQPIMDRFKIPATARASLAMYNTRADVDAFIAALRKIVDSESRVQARKKAAAAAAPKPRETGQAAVVYPKASAPSPQAAADALAEDFNLLEERDAKNEYLMDLGRKLPSYFDLLKQVTPRVPGCMSEVYLVPRRSADRPGAVEFVADANADIVRGLIAILERVYSGQRAEDVVAFDHEDFFRRIGLDQFITTQRRNGLDGMIRKLKAAAAELAAGQP